MYAILGQDETAAKNWSEAQSFSYQGYKSRGHSMGKHFSPSWINPGLTLGLTMCSMEAHSYCRQLAGACDIPLCPSRTVSVQSLLYILYYLTLLPFFRGHSKVQSVEIFLSF